MISSVLIQLPEWVDDYVSSRGSWFPSVEDRMLFVCELARRNVEMKTGGPFGAGVFDSTGNLVAVGVNRVEPLGVSIAHAEIVALSLAQGLLGTYDLGTRGNFELVTSTEPCAMCLGAVPWSGIRRVICGARDQDARAVGFDEGDKPDSWKEKLERRGIVVQVDVCRDVAMEVLREYVRRGGEIY